MDITGTLARSPGRAQGVLAITGKAGSGKTMLLARTRRSPPRGRCRDGFGRLRGAKAKGQAHARDSRAHEQGRQTSCANHGVPATTIHRIIYTPVYDPEYEKIAEWLVSGGGGSGRRLRA